MNVLGNYCISKVIKKKSQRVRCLTLMKLNTMAFLTNIKNDCIYQQCVVNHSIANSI